LRDIAHITKAYCADWIPDIKRESPINSGSRSAATIIYYDMDKC